jgi:hypothetical protein
VAVALSLVKLLEILNMVAVLVAGAKTSAIL